PPFPAFIENRNVIGNDSIIDHFPCQTELVIQFKCPCMDHHCPRFPAGFACLIDDPERYASLLKSNCHRQPCRPCAHNQYFVFHTTAPLRVLLPCSRFCCLIFLPGLDHLPREIRHDGFDTEFEKLFC